MLTALQYPPYVPRFIDVTFFIIGQPFRTQVNGIYRSAQVMAEHAKEAIPEPRLAPQISWHYFRDAFIDCLVKPDYLQGLFAQW